MCSVSSLIIKYHLQVMQLILYITAMQSNLVNSPPDVDKTNTVYFRIQSPVTFGTFGVYPFECINEQRSNPAAFQESHLHCCNQPHSVCSTVIQLTLR